MTDVGNSAEEFFLNSSSEQLETIYRWARARYAAPWAVFFGVLLRVAASVPAYVQLPPVIGGRASLNLFCAFVGKSGSGKGISDSVARAALPGEIVELPIGSGEGIAQQFANGSDGAVIFTVSEIDKLAGIAGRAGSILLAELKAAAMGEPIGQANAKTDTRRIVPAQEVPQFEWTPEIAGRCPAGRMSTCRGRVGRSHRSSRWRLLVG